MMVAGENERLCSADDAALLKTFSGEGDINVAAGGLIWLDAQLCAHRA
jgi:hypothetical protein